MMAKAKSDKSSPKRCVLLVNLGSPDAPTPRDVRRYLHQFLMDGRVIDVPWPLRKFIVTCTILPFRAARSAAAYRTIWSSEGSPLVATSKRVQEMVARRVSSPVELAMRYGNPSIADAIARILRGGDIEQIRLIPLYPHYAMSSYESSVAEVKRVIDKMHAPVKLEVIAPFYEDPDYIDALVESAGDRLNGDMDHLLFSYHGLPERHVTKSDPTGGHCLQGDSCCQDASVAHRTCYRHQVLRTTDLFVERAGIPDGRYSVAFQSRLGRDPWLKPATMEELHRLGASDVKNLKVICPAFVTDCLETLEEIEIRGRETFLSAGGERFEMIPCLNDHPRWLDTLVSWCEQEEPQLLPDEQVSGY